MRNVWKVEQLLTVETRTYLMMLLSFRFLFFIIKSVSSVSFLLCFCFFTGSNCVSRDLLSILLLPKRQKTVFLDTPYHVLFKDRYLLFHRPLVSSSFVNRETEIEGKPKSLQESMYPPEISEISVPTHSAALSFYSRICLDVL